MTPLDEEAHDGRSFNEVRRQAFERYLKWFQRGHDRDEPDEGERFSTPAIDEGFRIHALDVGQGQCTIVEAPNGETLVYDAGPSKEYDDGLGPWESQTAVAALDGLGIDHIDHLVVGHHHTDHLGGVTRILDEVNDPDGGIDDIGAVHAPDSGLVDPDANTVTDMYRSKLHEAGLEEQPLRAGDSIDLGRVSVNVLNPWGWDLPDPTQNQQSVVLHVDAPAVDRSALITGDVCGPVEAKLAANFPGLLADVDWVDVPYHGSVRSSGDIAEICDPSVAIISQGPLNDHDHPHDQTLEHIDALDIPETLSTGVHGCVGASLTEEGINITHHRGLDVDHEPWAIREAVRTGEIPEWKLYEEPIGAVLQPGDAPSVGTEEQQQKNETLVDALADRDLTPADIIRANEDDRLDELHDDLQRA